MPFVLLEVGLRITGIPAVQAGVDLDPVVDLNQLRPLFELDTANSTYQIPESRRNFFQPASFSAKKGSSVRRIFVLGGSTVQGRPYTPETAFAKWLQLRLRASDANHEYEVINCGGISYASYRVARILDEVLGYEPDAIVLYTGHNEFLEDRSYAGVRELGKTRATISRMASRLQTVRWLRSTMHVDDSARTLLPTEVDAKLDHRGGLDSYHRDSAWQQNVEQHFAVTLNQMVQRTQATGTPLILCTPASDLVNTPPIKSEQRSDWPQSQSDAFTQQWKQARDTTVDSNYRLAAAKKCLQIDPQHAGANYLTGRLLYELGDETFALAYLTAARDNDVCPLRATSSMVTTVRMTAKSAEIPLVDSLHVLDQRSFDGTRIADGIPDPEFFIDHVHPTIAGHQLIAQALLREFQTLGWIQPDNGFQQRYEALVQKHLATLGEEYYAHGKQRLEGLRRWASGRAGEMGLD